MLTSARTMTAHTTTHTHTHTKWGRMVATVLRPFKKAFDGAFAGKTSSTVRLDELTPEMLVEDPPPTAALTREQAEALHQLASHGPNAR